MTYNTKKTERMVVALVAAVAGISALALGGGCGIQYQFPGSVADLIRAGILKPIT